MEGTQMDDRPLLLAVESLTKPNRTKVIQGTHTATIKLPALLNQLEAAILGSIVGIGGSGSLANERNMINGEALFQALKIKAAIRDWCRMVGIDTRPKDKPIDLLPRWYAAYTSKEVTLEAERFYCRQLNAWATQITAMFNPPKVHDLPDACPICGATEWINDKDGLSYSRPLVVTFQPDTPDLIINAQGTCRACLKVWSARELAYEIEQKLLDQEMTG